jgi:hypothetical protein
MEILFESKPIQIPAEYRPMYKIAQVLLILTVCCRSGKGSLMKIHLFSWALKSTKNKEKLIEMVNKVTSKSLTIWSMEPSLNRALSYCVGQQFCIFESGSYKMSEKGKSFYQLIIKDNELLVSDKLFLKKIGKRFTESMVNELTKSWAKKI